MRSSQKRPESVVKRCCKNGAWAWARLRERFGRHSGATSYTDMFQSNWSSEKPFEDVWRERPKKVSKLTMVTELTSD